MTDVTLAKPFVPHLPPSEKPKWLAALAFALFVHVGLLAIVTYRSKVAEPDASPPMALDMSALPSSVAAPKEVPVEEPHPMIVQQEEVVTPVAPTPLVIPTAPAPNVVVEQKMEVKPHPVKQQVQRKKIVVKKTVTAAAAASIDARRASKNAAASRGATAHVSNVSAASWNSQVMSQLYQAKRFPARARWKNEEDLILASFSIGADGSLRGVRILRSKRISDLDEDVSDMVRRVGHVPPPPNGATSVTVRLNYMIQ